MVRLCACLWLGALGAVPALAERPPKITLDDIRAAVEEQWRGVRDLTVEDRLSLIEYRRVGPVPLPKAQKTPMGSRPNRWTAAPGLEYLELWRGDNCARIAFDGTVTRWQGRRNAFAEPHGRICAGNNVPTADLSFAYYVGRFGRYSGLAHFLARPDTRLVKANKRVNEIVCHRVEGVAAMDIEGEEKPYVVTIDIAPQHGWMPLRAEFTDAATGDTVRVYRVRSFFNQQTFPFPREAQIDVYERVAPEAGTAGGRTVLTSSLVCQVERVLLNQGFGPGNFVFSFEPGTEVRDERTGEVYIVPAEPGQ